MTGTSKTKFCKGTTIPKHSGNFSAFMMHYQSKSYPLELHEYIDSDGYKSKAWFINNTPASGTLPQDVIALLSHDKFFKFYEREGIYKHPETGKEYTCTMRICRTFLRGYGMPEFKFTLGIDTRGDFKFNFPEY